MMLDLDQRDEELNILKLDQKKLMTPGDQTLCLKQFCIKGEGSSCALKGEFVTDLDDLLTGLKGEVKNEVPVVKSDLKCRFKTKEVKSKRKREFVSENEQEYLNLDFKTKQLLLVE